MSLTGQPGEEPRLLGGKVSVTAAGLYAAIAAMLGLLQRDLTGQGQTATVSAIQCLESFMEQAMLEYTLLGVGTERKGNRGRITALSGALKCKDGHFVISQVHGAESWKRFVDWMQDPVLSADPSLAQEEKQDAGQDFILNRVEEWASQFNRTELVEEAQRRHMPASPVATPLDLVQDPQLLARGFLSELVMRSWVRSRSLTELSQPPWVDVLHLLPKSANTTTKSSQSWDTPKRNATMRIYFEDLTCGSALPSRQYGPLTVADTVRWAGLQENWSQLHFDRDYVREHNGT